MSELNTLTHWFKERPVWLQDAAVRLIKKAKLDKEDYKELYQSCVDEAAGSQVKADYKLSDSLFSKQSSSGELKLKSIGDIEGINCLSPKNPLEFGNENLAVIYGLNGSGKSGYTRILKHMCGAKSLGELHGNVYKTEIIQRKCSIEYSKDGSDYKYDWIADNGLVDDLGLVDIFDSECGKAYISDENKVRYEPQVLLFFRDLVSVCEKITLEIGNEEEKKVSKKPTSPPEYDNTHEIKWYSTLSKDTENGEVNDYCLWTTQNEQHLAQLTQRISEIDPSQRAKEIRQKNQHALSLIENTEKYKKQFSDEICKQINTLKEKVVQTKKTAKVTAEKAFSQAPLIGTGSETWQRLWEYAREYSQQEAYKGSEFPVITNQALCVLCQQPLSNDAIDRMTSFERFVKGAVQKEVIDAQQSLQKASTPITESQIPAEENLKLTIDAAGLTAEEYFPPLAGLYIALRKRKGLLINPDTQLDFISLPSMEEWTLRIKQIITDEEQKARIFDEDARGENKADLHNKLKALQAKKWISQQRDAIKEEIERLKYLSLLKSAKGLTNTTALSVKTSKLADELITEAFIERFKKELTKLGADKISIQLVKSRISKGNALHKLQLKGAEHSTVEHILSEGEYRIVALSAFLADVMGKEYSAPFVFDDPISSLDQDFEEAVVKRLVELSKDRQVIIFTHRLPMFGLVQDYAKKENIKPEIVCVRKEEWGAGEPGGIPLSAKKPENALNSLLSCRLPQAQKTLNQTGKEAYEPTAKSICTDFRIIIEKVIEYELLADVVQRYRRAVNTQGKIHKLAKIQKSDCTFLDELMTKYSRFEHSQSPEAPVHLPNPDEMEQDFNGLKEWLQEFKQRDNALPI